MFYFEFLISVCVASFIGKDLAPMQGTANAMLLRPGDLRVRSPELRGEHGSQRRSCHAVVIFCLKNHDCKSGSFRHIETIVLTQPACF